MNGDNLLKMTIEASTLGLGKNVWPETFEFDGKTWTKDYMLVAKSGEVQCVDYRNGDQYLVVYND